MSGDISQALVEESLPTIAKTDETVDALQDHTN